MNTSITTTSKIIRSVTFAFVFAISAIVASSATAQTPLETFLRSTPCRMLDTRNAGGSIQANEIRIFSVDPLFSSLQGGASNCGVPGNALAVKISVTGSSVTYNGGYFRIFNASASVFGTYSMLQLKEPGTWASVQIDVPVDGNLQVAIHSIVQAHAVVDLIGWFEAAE